MCLKIDGGKGGKSKLNGISYAYSITYVLNINRFEAKRNEMLRIEQTQQQKEKNKTSNWTIIKECIENIYF